MMVSKFVIAFTCFILPSSLLHADEIQLADVHVVDNKTLSTLRGGFQLSNDYVVDIGISISAAVNGENIYRTTIANLVFRNGTLTTKPISGQSVNPVDSNLVNIVQVGDGNVIGNADSPSTPPQISQPGVTGPSVINIIQNTLDNSVLGLNTVIDVDARVEGINKQIRDDLRLKDALLNHRY